jgi:flavin-dependent dehydrogenase
MGVALEAEVEPDQAALQAFQGRFLIGLDAAKDGYCWIFPKSSHLSVGIGNMRKGASGLKQQLMASMERYGVSLGQARILGHPLPTYTGRKRLHQGPIGLLGDAAGLVDPLTGEGIRHALLSGKLAAEAIAQGGLDGYSRRVWKEIGRDLLWAGRLARLFYMKQAASFSWLIRNAWVFEDMMHIVSNRLSYMGAVFKLPLYAMMVGKRRPLDAELLPGVSFASGKSDAMGL